MALGRCRRTFAPHWRSALGAGVAAGGLLAGSLMLAAPASAAPVTARLHVIDWQTHAGVGGVTVTFTDKVTGDIQGSCTADATGACKWAGYQTDLSVKATVSNLPPGYATPPASYLPVVTTGGTTDIPLFVYPSGSQSGGATFIQKESDDGTYLDDAVFDLFKDGTRVSSCTTGSNTTVGPGGCLVTGLALGTYVWVETKAPAGYQLPTGVAAQTTVTVAVINPPSIGVKEITNSRVRTPPTSSLTVKKIDASSKTTLAGAQFALLKDGAASGPSCTTGADGTCRIDGLSPGSYRWHETVAPIGYGVAPNSDAVVIDATNAGSDLAATTVADERTVTTPPVTPVGDTPLTTPVQPPTTWTLIVTKVDATNRARTLSNAVYDLYRESNETPGLQTASPADTVVGSCRTDSSGSCTVSTLPAGSYYLKERAAPAGYQLEPDATPVTVSGAGTAVATTVADRPIITPDTSQGMTKAGLAVTGSDTGQLLGVGLTLGAVGLLALALARRRGPA
ncbi:MAG: hypothetical protein JO147_07220 [Actinobacteria bacterium]|nr:hypothetical protein [Actinomycetota bacterium]